MNEQRLLYLIDKCQAGKATPAEAEELKDWYNAFDEVETDNEYIHKIGTSEYLKSRYKDLLENVSAQNRRHKIFRIVWKAAAVAAVLILAITVSWKFYIGEKKTSALLVKADIAPGHDGAILTLANGSKVVLDSAGNKQIVQQGNISITNTNGQLTYANNKADALKPAYNTLSTPRARQYKIILPDGTKVWLNAESSIHYPVAFTGNERKVEITGEAYFEVMHNSKTPFRVVADNETVEDLGTHFNIDAYPDEHTIKTTLLEGSVKVTRFTDRETKLLNHSGQQAQLTNKAFDIIHVNPEDAIAWQEGYFIFDNEPLENVMNNIARWYNVNIIFKDETLKRENTYGYLSRFSNVSKVLNLLELTGAVKFNINGNTIIVDKK